jgi:hypothetical protein
LILFKIILIPILFVIWIWTETGYFFADIFGVTGGVHTIYQAACGDGASILIRTDVERRSPLDFELGGSVGFGLFYQQAGQSYTLYRNGDAGTNANNSLLPKNPLGYTWSDFAPLPVGLNLEPLKVFATPTMPYLDDRAPRFINIFLDNSVSQVTFNAIANCLDVQKQAINDALTKIQEHYPESYRQNDYVPFVLGGVALGVQPYSNAKYIAFEKEFWGGPQATIALALDNSFTLFPGQSTRVVVGGKLVMITLDQNSNLSVTVNGKLLPQSDDYQVGQGVCTPETVMSCARGIVLHSNNFDGSMTFDMLADSSTYGGYFPGIGGNRTILP